MTSQNNKVDTDAAGAPDKGVGCGALIRRMDPNRFVIGERVLYRNHVTGAILGYLEVAALDGEFVMAKRLFGKIADFKFHRDGRATWSSNLLIEHAEQPMMCRCPRGHGASNGNNLSKTNL